MNGNRGICRPDHRSLQRAGTVYPLPSRRRVFIRTCRGSVATRSKCQAHQLFHRQRKDAEHQVAHHLPRATHPDVASAKLLLESSVDPLHGGAFTEASRLSREEVVKAVFSRSHGQYRLVVSGITFLRDRRILRHNGTRTAPGQTS